MLKPDSLITRKLLATLTVQGTGFTLLELMIVVMISSILALIALPNVMSQIGKARETEAKMVLSTIGMAQQTYFFEKQSFASKMQDLDVTVKEGYYNYPDPNLVSTTIVKHQAVPYDAANRNIRHYSLGVYYNNNLSYSVTLCQSRNPSLETEVANTPEADCVSGVRLE
jgi:type IV pilus assembly protein PilA